jgi:serine/threonine-protein kinase RsbW
MIIEEFEIINSMGGLCILKDTVEQVSSSWKLSKKVTLEINLILEELCANYLEHSGDDASHSSKIKLILHDTKITILVEDSGPPFNPKEVPSPEVTMPLEDRIIGGLGLYFVKHFAEEITYKRDNDVNLLTITKAI